MRKRILDCKTDSIEQFRSAAELAKELGMTHMVVSHIEKSIWQWNQDRNDPYPNWGMYNPSIFKVVVPEELKKYLPLDYAERNFETISKRSEILKEYGLEAVFDAMEPAWLPEDVYIDHPSWRGPRCDQPRRARKAYYAPCTDNPEVEQMYMEAIYKLCKSVTVSMFNIMTNDSGGGICWSERLYPGANGPRRCRHLSVGDRAVHFLDIVQKAAAKAGVEAEAGYSRYFTEADDLLNLQASKWLSGNSAWGLIYKSTAAAFKPLNEAICNTKKLLQCDIGEYKDELEELLLRLRMYYCIITNAKNVVWFQSSSDRTDYETEPKDVCDVNDEQGDLRLYKIWEIVRDEIDNTHEMIEILDSAKKPVLVLADSKQNEDVMTLGPDIKSDLLKKISIMEAHRADFNRLYRTANL